MMRFLFVVSLSALLVLGCPMSQPSEAHAELTGRLIFVSNRDEVDNYEIYAIDLTGGLYERLTNSRGFDGDATVTLSGDRLAFYSTRSGREEIYVAAADGSGAQALTQSSRPIRNFCPAWSPDGSAIAFASTPEGNDDIFIINADGSGLRQLTYEPSLDMCPSWSPDGKQLVYSADYSPVLGSDRKRNLYVISADGGQATKITNLTNATLPEWSPDGRYIAFQSFTNVMLVSPAGGELRSIGLGTRPVWSPDGKWLAAIRQSEIVIFAMEGSQTLRVPLPQSSVRGAEIRSVSWTR